MMTIVRSLRVVIEMPCDGFDYSEEPNADLMWLENVFNAIRINNGKIGSWGIMEEEIE